MLGKRGQIGRSHSTVCTKSESFDDGGNLNQCNFASMITTQEDSNSEPRFSLYETLENMASDRFISRLHTNLDCRFAMPPTLSLEMRRPTYLLAPRKTAAPSHLRTTAEDVSVSGQETKWPNPLTNSSLAYITQRFCTNFFNRYCAPLGDQCTITAEYDTCKQSELSSRDPNTRFVEEAGENLRLPQSSPSKTVNSGPSSPICPVFFASSLVDTMKAAERPNGRPWPVILLYLHHEESPHTQRFLSLMFYEPHEEYAKPAPTEIEKGISIPKPSGVPPGRERTVAPPASLEKTKSARNISTKRSERNSMTESSGFAKSTKSKRSSLILFKRSSIPPPGCNTADGTPNKKSASQRGYRLFHTNHGKGRRNSHVSEKNTSESTNQSTSDFSTKPLLKSGQSPVIGFSESVNESRQSTKASYYRQQLSNQNSAIESEQHRNKMNLLSESTNATSIPIKSEEDAKAFETPLASETFRTVLIERTSGVVPWDCTDAAGRAYLAQAFPGTRLVQWLKQWQKPTDYPSIIAIGRTAERDVVCSRLQAYQATRLKAVRWLNDVTLAHFYNYRKPNIPICPEYSERLFQSPPKSVTPPSETHAVSCVDAPETTVAPSGVSPEGSPRSTQTSHYPRSILTTVADGEIVDHVFTSCMNTRPNTGEKSRSSALRVSPEEIIYRVIKTPQLQTGPISELFELPVNRPSERFREHLRKVQYSFKQAIAALSKSTTPEALTRLGIALPSPVIPAKLGLYRSVSSSVLIEALCKVSSTESATSNARANKRSATAATESNTHRTDLQKKPTRNHTVVLNSSRPGSMSSPQRSRPFHSVPKASEQRVDERLLRSSATSGPRNASPGAFHSVNARLRSAESQITELKVTSGWNFYEQFCKQFIVDFPSKPSFLLGSLGTAVLRCVDVLRQQQNAPLLIYLHDNQAPGTSHFVANILCSRRFNHKLLDSGISVWPLDVTKDGRPPLKYAHIQSCKQADSLEQSRSVQSFYRFQRKRTNEQSEARCVVSGGIVTRDLKYSGRSNHNTGRPCSKQSQLSNRCSLSQRIQPPPTPTSPSNDTPTTDLSPNRDQVTGVKRSYLFVPSSINRGSIGAQQLLDYFSGHPAEETLKRIFMIPVLPSVINVSYKNKLFSVTHVLLPSSTTKEAVLWLSTVTKLYSRSRNR